MVVNRNGQHPAWKSCARVHTRFSATAGRARYMYHKCGRKSKLSKVDWSWLLRRLKLLRKSGPCTSTMLRRGLAKHRGVFLEASMIRRTLLRRGYKWLPRRRKTKFIAEVRAKRRAFSQEVVDMTSKALRERLSMAMDGVVLTMPLADPIARHNFGRSAEQQCRRKRSEGNHPDFAGAHKYAKQAPVSMFVPLWGGCSAGGFAVVLWHQQRKVTAAEWSVAVSRGMLKKAILSLKPRRRRGPLFVIADNESPLRAPASRDAHEKAGVHVWGIPLGSPDLNPVEKRWSWLRRRLVALDLRDLKMRKKALDRAAFKARVQSFCRSQKAQRVAASCALGLKKVVKRCSVQAVHQQGRESWPADALDNSCGRTRHAGIT